jgi:DNA-directed RNA polymerase subunit beta'
MLKTFHNSGVAGGDITTGLPRVEELFEARNPKGQAFISEITGVVDSWEDGKKYIVQVTPTAGHVERIALDGRHATLKAGSEVKRGDVIAEAKDAENPLFAPFDGVVEFTEDTVVIAAGANGPVRYEIPGTAQLMVKPGDNVEAGDRLTSGSLNLHDLMRLKGTEATQRYIINEVLGIYAAQGQDVADKHLEIIVRQMFSRVQVEDPGDSTFVMGDIVSKASVVDANRGLVAEGKNPAQYTQLLLGITKVSIWSDSWLSAASFQDTTRVLINAATSGRADHLRGLKENVIIGRKIPVGTGAGSVLDESEDEIYEDTIAEDIDLAA